MTQADNNRAVGEAVTRLREHNPDPAPHGPSKGDLFAIAQPGRAGATVYFAMGLHGQVIAAALTADQMKKLSIQMLQQARAAWIVANGLAPEQMAQDSFKQVVLGMFPDLEKKPSAH